MFFFRKMPKRKALSDVEHENQKQTRRKNIFFFILSRQFCDEMTIRLTCVNFKTIFTKCNFEYKQFIYCFLIEKQSDALTNSLLCSKSKYLFLSSTLTKFNINIPLFHLFNTLNFETLHLQSLDYLPGLGNDNDKVIYEHLHCKKLILVGYCFDKKISLPNLEILIMMCSTVYFLRSLYFMGGPKKLQKLTKIIFICTDPILYTLFMDEMIFESVRKYCICGFEKVPMDKIFPNAQMVYCVKNWQQIFDNFEKHLLPCNANELDQFWVDF